MVATPGRLIDHLERGTIDLQDVQFVVLDEADRMLDMGFIDDVDYIMRKLPNGSQTALFSATMPKEIVRLADRYMNHPLNVLIDSDELSIDEIDQSYAIVDDRSKFQALVEYVRKNKISTGIIFCATRSRLRGWRNDCRRKGLERHQFMAICPKTDESTLCRTFAVDTSRSWSQPMLQPEESTSQKLVT